MMNLSHRNAAHRLLMLAAGSAAVVLLAGTSLSAAGLSVDDKPVAAVAAATDPRLADFTAAADYSAKLGGRAVLVMHKGKIVFERYDNNWNANMPHPLASGTKSFTGVTAAIAIKQGLISGWDELVCDTITEWKTDPVKKDITLRHLLTLSSGLDPSDDTLGTSGGSRVLGPGTGSRQERNRGSREVSDKFKAAVTTESVAKPGARFEYGPSHYFAFGEFLQRKLTASKTLPPEQKTVMGYMQANLFDPIGLKVGRFGKDAAGNPNLPGGCMLTAREWVKFGQLVLQDGTWTGSDGKPVQVVDKALLAECMKPSATNKFYGFTWWLLRENGQTGTEGDGLGRLAGGGAGGVGGVGGAGGAGDDRGDLRARLRQAALSREASNDFPRPDGQPWNVFMAAGLGKQRLFVLPQEDMVIVRFAENGPEGRSFDNGEFLSLALGYKKDNKAAKPAKPGQ